MHKSIDQFAAPHLGAENKINQPRFTTIDPGLTFRGDLESTSDILVQGGVVGNITCNRLFVDKSAYVEGDVEANEVVVCGYVVGLLKADKVHLAKTAQAECDIYQNKVIAEEGAYISGALNRLAEAPARGSVPVSETSIGSHQPALPMPADEAVEPAQPTAA